MNLFDLSERQKNINTQKSTQKVIIFYHLSIEIHFLGSNKP